jgi:arylsulfatase A-like enzyme
MRGFLVFLLLITGCSQDVAQSADRPNVLFLVVDDASWEEFTELKLPVIQDKLSDARVYQSFYVSPVCSPTRVQFHFGQYPHRSLVGNSVKYKQGEGVAVGEPSLARTLTQDGYATALFGKWHVNGQRLPMQVGEAGRLHGYQTWRAGSVNNVYGPRASHYNWERWDDGHKSTETQYSTHAIGDSLIKWWGETDGPKFGVCAFLAPHEPFERAPTNLLAGQTFSNTQRGKYESALVGIDTKIRQIHASLDLSNTYVFLFPDNGTPPEVPPPSAKERGYKLTPWQGGINVPLMVWGPGVVPGIELGLVQAVDLPSTVLELVGGPKKEGEFQDSISFAKTLNHTGPSRRDWVWSQRFHPSGKPRSAQLDADSWAVVRSDGWKLIKHPGELYRSAKLLELYNLNKDPHETSPVADERIETELQSLRTEALGEQWPY